MRAGAAQPGPAGLGPVRRGGHLSFRFVKTAVCLLPGCPARGPCGGLLGGAVILLSRVFLTHRYRSHEWKKHGTCAAQLDALNSQRKYFSKSLDLYKELALSRWETQACM